MRNKLIILIILIMLAAGIYLVSDSSASTIDTLPRDKVVNNTSEAKNPSSTNSTITITLTTASPPDEV